MVAETVPEGPKRGRSAQMAGQSPVYAVYDDAEDGEEEGQARVGGNHDDYEKSKGDLREGDQIRRHPQPGQEEHYGVIDSTKEHPGRITEVLFQGAVGVGGRQVFDHGK